MTSDEQLPWVSLDEESIMAEARERAGRIFQVNGGSWRRLQLLQATEHLLLDANQVARQQLLPQNSRLVAFLCCDVVDILDENNVALQVAKVFDERAMPAGPEQQCAGLLAKWLVVQIYRDEVGAGFLCRETDVE